MYCLLTSQCKPSKISKKGNCIPKWFLDYLFSPSKFPFLESISIFGNYQKRKLNSKMVFGSLIPAIKFPFLAITKKGNPIPKSFLNHLCEPSKFPFLVIISLFGNYQKRKFCSQNTS